MLSAAVQCGAEPGGHNGTFISVVFLRPYQTAAPDLDSRLGRSFILPSSSFPPEHGMS